MKMGGIKRRRLIVGSHSGAATYINLKIKYSLNDNEVYFNVMRNCDLRRVMDVSCERLSLELNDIRFVYKGHFVLAESTPDQLGMEDGDVIDAISVRPRTQLTANPGTINVSVCSPVTHNNRLHFRINKSTRLIISLMRAYCDQISMPVDCFAFLWEGRRLQDNLTPDELKMEDMVEIDAMPHQPGCENCCELPWNGIL
ncbi:PREDICTED: ubiquitin-like protein pmt3/smt3 [Fragaria vesca subsp. vesca]|uniref:ubiquitin-like protein pmt3/smt3 n=1 Tax=Fragaria vesca subsp. vesca TaxID=101020 RepID=UPI0002C32831|nr:PREDICTED: ubiquitin-like protein pmt3/smt3 [Fragaria vesca subsp. vesca]XP_011461069.1 PREDICTED: ubiquitin-like protein pmt3/smt3 [Fragaria vesca subsp. vesca]XP_011461070.1 PREDICTED: ubiquitin-like protein pmt3/smt3 [Fragaria vesca subsp. vesca]XP_011461071.1 PREDICTED: ubiquitin-like protein pmt3/smt3 [Fragaria vesca subsp. vesca]XP_011461072.1 PREDICTED: ubiquitin-like protein pmt3/smt3 [Fragaria vesca subsp. vesca]XP_011461073.1 PREDICTED: ubiquitin-like protein pmt3/smt3 [Fragaria v